MESNAIAPEIIAVGVVLLIVVPIVKLGVVGCICVFGKEKVASVVERSRRKRAPVSPLATGPFRRLSTMFGSSKSIVPDENKAPSSDVQLPAPADRRPRCRHDRSVSTTVAPSSRARPHPASAASATRMSRVHLEEGEIVVEAHRTGPARSSAVTLTR